MTHNEKDLLLKDLCARLPYEIKVSYKGKIYQISAVSICNETITIYGEKGYPMEVQMKDCKPHLFPMSSMTKKQNLEYLRTCRGGNADVPTLASFDWCDKNHFDYRGLIPMGSAEDATGKNIY